MERDGTSPSTTGGVGRIGIDLAVEDPAWRDELPAAGAVAETAARAALDRVAPGPPLALCLVLTDDKRIQALNREWRGVDRPTNVLSFPAEELEPGSVPRPPAGAPPGLAIELGDVVLARQTVLAEAAEAGRPAEHHLAHLVVHGVLHLLGWDHQEDAEAAAMEAMERDILAGLGVPDPYEEAA